jgi:hypothetical protein
MTKYKWMEWIGYIACTGGKQETETKNWSEYLKSTDHFRGLDMDGRKIWISGSGWLKLRYSDETVLC